MAASTFLDILSKKPDVVQEEFGSDAEDSPKIHGEDRKNAFRHKKLLEAIGSLGGKKKVTPRNEPSLTVSEYDLSQASKEKVAVHQLLLGLKKTESQRQIRRQVRAISRNAKVLAKPLHRPEVERAQRQVAYDKVGEEISVWDPVVKKNRLADQLRFPLKQADLRMERAGTFIQRMKPRTELEKEINKILKVSEDVAPQEAALTPAEEKALKAMSLEEAKERLGELRKMRALLSYQEMKARRQGKIKSKKYHRILKKERLKKEMKEFEELKEKDPELAIEKLRELEKQRILERVSLRHKSTGKWAKQQMLRTKYNQESREALLKQLELSRQLTAKALVESSESEDEMDAGDAGGVGPNSHTGELEARFFNSANPWLKNPTATRPKAGSSNADTSANVVDEDGDNQVLAREEEVEMADEKESLSKTQPEEGPVPDPAKGEEADSDVDTSAGKKDDAEVEELKPGKRAKRRAAKKARKRKLASSGGVEDEAEACDTKQAKSAAKTASTADIEEAFDRLGKLAAKQRKEKQLSRKAGKEEKRKKKPAVVEKQTASETEGEERHPASEEPVAANEEPETERTEAQLSETLERKRTLKDLETFADEAVHPAAPRRAASMPQPAEQKADKVEVDPTKFLEVKQQALRSRAPDLSGPADDALDDEDVEEDQAVTIAEAFADDDVISAFREEKKAQVKQDTPQGTDLFLPGWGAWGGGGIKVDKRKRRRFFVKPPPAPPRKDQTLGNVIISEAKEEKLEAHQVEELPFPFNNVSQFEAVISHPMGHTWNPETSFRELTAPKVVTQLGKVIDPIDKDALPFKKKVPVLDQLRERQKEEQQKEAGGKKPSSSSKRPSRPQRRKKKQ